MSTPKEVWEVLKPVLFGLVIGLAGWGLFLGVILPFIEWRVKVIAQRVIKEEWEYIWRAAK